MSNWVPTPVPERGDDGEELVVGEDLVDARLLHVQHFAPQREDCLEHPVPSLLGAAARGVTFDDVQLALLRVILGAVGELAGEA